MSLHTISTLKRITPNALHQRLLTQLNNNNASTTTTPSNISSSSSSSTTANNASSTSPSEPSIAIIDVRDADHVGGHIRSSRHVPSASFALALPRLLEQLRGTKTVVFHCALSSQRGPATALAYLRGRDEMLAKMRKEGRDEGNGEQAQEQEQEQEVLLLEGGFTRWQQL